MASNDKVNKIFIDLKKNDQRIVLSGKECVDVYELFRGKKPNANAVVFNKNKDYRAFLQAAMIRLIDGSNDMSWLNALLNGAYKPNATVGGIITKLIKHGIKQYFENKMEKPEEISVAVRDEIVRKNRFRFEYIVNGLRI